MKKLFTVALLAITIATSAFAADENKINAVITSAFKSEFKHASNVVWVASADFAKATFVLNNHSMEAFYNQNGEKIATSTSITLDELPTRAKRDFAKRFAGYTVREAISMQFPEEEAYFISGESDTEKIILKVSDQGNVSVYKRTKK